MKTTRKRLALTVMTLLTTGLLMMVFTAPNPAQAQARQKRYVVEMILFRNQGLDNLGGEVWGEETLVPDTAGAVELSAGGLPPGFKMRSPETGGLSRDVKLLDRSPRYQVLQHLVWEQPGLAEADAIPVRIHAGRDYGVVNPGLGDATTTPSLQIINPVELSELDGTVTIILGRYLHVHTDLVYRQPGPEAPASSTFAPPSLINAPIVHARRMRSGELHYLDHPFVGILVKITPLAPAS